MLDNSLGSISSHSIVALLLAASIGKYRYYRGIRSRAYPTIDDYIYRLSETSLVSYLSKLIYFLTS